MKAELKDMDIRLTEMSMKQARLKKKIQRLSQKIKEARAKAARQQRIIRMLELAKDAESANAAAQAVIQDFLETNGITLISYREVSAGKWEDYGVARMEFRFKTNTAGLAKLLKLLQDSKDLMRVESLTVSYRRGREAGLQVLMRVGTLFFKAGNTGK